MKAIRSTFCSRMKRFLPDWSKAYRELRIKIELYQFGLKLGVNEILGIE
jgi:hypothetical protein